MRTTSLLVSDASASPAAAAPLSAALVPSERTTLHAARDAARQGLQRVAHLAARYAHVPCVQVVFLDPALGIWDLTVGALGEGTAEEAIPDGATLYRDGHLTDRVEIHSDLYAHDRWTTLTPPSARFFAGFQRAGDAATDDPATAAPAAALCLWDTRARVLHPDQIAFLADLAAMLTEPLRRYQSEAARYRTEARFRRIAEATPDALVLAAPDRTIVGVNPAFERLFGYAPDEVIGQTTQMLYAHPEDYEEQGRVRYHPDAAEQPQAYEVAYRRRDGDLFTSETVGVKIRDGADGFLAMIRDVSEREAMGAALAESERHLREVVGHTPIVLWAIDTEGIVTLSDGLGLQAMGLEPGQLVGESLFEMYADDPNIVAALQRGLDGAAEQWRSQVGDMVYDNQTRPLVEDGAVVGLLGVSLDVTQREQDEAALRQARDEAEAAARLIRAFLANINHELRTPLTGLLGCADWLLHDAPPELQDPLRLIHQSSLRLKTTLDSVLDLARIEAGEMPTTT
ncbi:MAG: PAS domain S-box protein, partial [Bacteroidota bacterium]